MDWNSGNYGDKTRVLDIKPLRTLRPVFPNGNQAPPFVCAPPFGPFPPGFSPFYPFSSSQATQHTPDLNQAQYPPQQHQPQNPPQQHQPQNASEPSLVTPLRSFRSPVTSNGNTDPEGSTVKRKIPKKRTTIRPENAVIDSRIGLAERENGNRHLVNSVLMRFDALRRRLAQLDDAKEAVSGIIKRPDLKSGSTCMSRGVRTNTKKRPGIVPGVEIGDIFYFRFEMCLVGLHSPSMAGIDYLVVKGETEEEPIATSIVSSGYYGNDDSNPDVLIYTGQGGNADKDKQTSDQKLERGNLALEMSLRKNRAVRVIRGWKEGYQNSNKIYIYDGLYEIKESWVEKGKSGHNTFKYKLVRAPGQPPAFARWTEIQKWRAGMPSRQGLILSDITAGAESVPVSVVNEVDTENRFGGFTYSTEVKYSESFKLTQPSFGCDCGNSCKPGNLNCYCIKKNGGDFPYTFNGVLVTRKPMIYECSPSCPCSTCKSKVTQTGLKLRLEVFRTANRGWGLRSWDPIRAGSFICIYAGEAKDKSKLQQHQQTIATDDYTFDSTRVFTPFKWNYEHSLADEVASVEMPEESEFPLPLIISAKNSGNVSRFMNHSCSPNVFWQAVSYENNSQLFLHVAFFAISHIPPMTELTYDYGVSQASGSQNGIGRKKCFCGSEYCRGSFG